MEAGSEQFGKGRLGPAVKSWAHFRFRAGLPVYDWDFLFGA